MDVTVVVGKNFKELVLENDKHVLLEVYAPWCPHCKKFEPIYNKIGKKFKNHSDILIANFNGADNEHDNVVITGFPTTFLYKKGEKDKPIKFEGNNTFVDIIEFLKKNEVLKQDEEIVDEEL